MVYERFSFGADLYTATNVVEFFFSQVDSVRADQVIRLGFGLWTRFLGIHVGLLHEKKGIRGYALAAVHERRRGAQKSRVRPPSTSGQVTAGIDALSTDLTSLARSIVKTIEHAVM
jgi:hypothetical protein